MNKSKIARNNAEPPKADVLLQKNSAGGDVKVSVIVSLYNYGQYLSACLDSVHDQTLTELDLIVVDDCSTNDSTDIAKHWLTARGKRFSRFQLLRHRRNCGLASTRNTAFAHTATPFVFVLDADNILYPRCLERQLQALENSSASFAYCIAERFGDVSGLTNYIPWNPTQFAINNTIDAMVLMRKSEWEKVGGYSTDMPVMGWEDFDLWFKIARAGGWGVLVPEVLTRYRVHGSSMLQTVTNPKVNLLWPHLRKTYPEFFVDTPQLATCHSLGMTG
jgi:glycosyltransferase involved in cell wall biosynthesis